MAGNTTRPVVLPFKIQESEELLNIRRVFGISSLYLILEEEFKAYSEILRNQDPSFSLRDLTVLKEKTL